jgi:hypothetical protein
MPTPTDLLNETRDLIMASLPPEIAAKLKAEVDTAPLPKNGVQRLLIYARRPGGFWKKGWCSYEIGIGRYAAEPDEDSVAGGTGFFCAVNQAGTGGGACERPLGVILDTFNQAHGRPWRLRKPGDERNGKTANRYFLQRRYRMAELGQFSELASRDACLLIAETFPKIAAMLANTGT